MRSTIPTRKLLGAGLVALSVCSGCSTLSKNKSMSKDDHWSITKLWKQEYQEPASVAAIWSPDEMVMVGQPTQRGFGGRIYFYNDRSQAVPVEGDLLIHGYLTTPGAEQEDVKADKKYEFRAEQLASHFSPSEIGASYSVWVPWDDAGGFREEVTVIPTFKSKDGTVVQGAPARVFLPGKARLEDELPAPKFQQVSYTRESVKTNDSSNYDGTGNVRTTTIELPGDASLGRTRQSFLLGGSQTGAGTSSQSGSHLNSATSGNRNSFELKKPAQPQTPTRKTPEKMDLQHLAPPPSMHRIEGTTASLPLSVIRDLPSVESLNYPVQPASFNAPR